MQWFQVVALPSNSWRVFHIAWQFFALLKHADGSLHDILPTIYLARERLWWLFFHVIWDYWLYPSFTQRMHQALAVVTLVSGQSRWLTVWFLCNITFPVFLARLTPNRQSAGRYASIIFCMCMAAILGVDLTERLFRFEAGSAVLAAVVLALLFHGLAARITRLLIPKTASEVPAENPFVPEAIKPIEKGSSNYADHIADTPLTPREREAAVLLLQRLSTQDIARAMGISENTAIKHIQSALRKCGAADLHQFILQHVGATRKSGANESRRRRFRQIRRMEGA